MPHIAIRPKDGIRLEFAALGGAALSIIHNNPNDVITRCSVVSKTHNQITLRPPPATRFTLIVNADGTGSDVAIEFERGREREICEWLKTWINLYIEPEAVRADAIAKQREEEKREAARNKHKPKKLGPVDHAAAAAAAVANQAPLTTNVIPEEEVKEDATASFDPLDNEEVDLHDNT